MCNPYSSPSTPGEQTSILFVHPELNLAQHDIAHTPAHGSNYQQHVPGMPLRAGSDVYPCRFPPLEGHG